MDLTVITFCLQAKNALTHILPEADISAPETHEDYFGHKWCNSLPEGVRINWQVINNKNHRFLMKVAWKKHLARILSKKFTVFVSFDHGWIQIALCLCVRKDLSRFLPKKGGIFNNCRMTLQYSLVDPTNHLVPRLTKDLRDLVTNLSQSFTMP